MSSVQFVMIFTAHIQRMGEGTLFSSFVSSHLGGGVPKSGLWGYPIPCLAGGVPHPRSRGKGVSHPRSGWGGTQGTPPPNRSGWGTPQTWDRVPPQPGMGYPLTWDGVPPPDLGQGTPLDLEWGTPPRPGNGVTPQTWDRVPPRPGTGYPPDLGWGTPPRPGMGPPPTWDIASTCYVAGSMPLAFTQEDFLVLPLFKIYYALIWIYCEIKMINSFSSSCKQHIQ